MYKMIKPELLKLERKYLGGLDDLWFDSGCNDEELRYHLLELRKIVQRLYAGGVLDSIIDRKKCRGIVHER